MVTVKKPLAGVRTGAANVSVASLVKPTENVSELIRSKSVAKLSDICKVLSRPSLSDSYLVAVLQAVQESVSSFDRTLQFFIQVLLKLDWSARQRDTRTVYRKTMLEFVAAHNWCLKDVLAAFIGKLRSTRFTLATLDSTALQNDSGKLHADEAVFCEIHESLVELGRLVPLSPTFHIETIEQLALYPLNGQQLFAQFAYARNALRLADSFVHNRKAILNWYVAMLLQIDLNVTITSKSSQQTKESEETQLPRNDPFRQFRFTGDVSASCSNLYETGDVLEFLRTFHDAPVAKPSTDNVVAKAASTAAAATATPTASTPTYANLSSDELNTIKLDLLLSLLFDYFETVSKRCASAPPSDISTNSATAVKAGTKRKRANSTSDADPHAHLNAAFIELFDEFLAVFERQVLALNGHPSCVQFTMLWLCSLVGNVSRLDPKAVRHSRRLELTADLRARLCNFLWSKFEVPAENVFVRCNAVHYLADFLARFAGEDERSPCIDLVRSYLTKLCEFAHAYASRVAKEHGELASSPLENAKRHAVYYAAVRSAAFLLAYRHDALVTDVTFLTSLRLQSLISTQLNPLLFCDPQLVVRFAHVAQTLQIAYVDNVIERNRRLLQSMALTAAQTTNNTQMDAGQLAVALGFDFDTTFPFRSMPLISVSRYIAPLFRPYEEALIYEDSMAEKTLESQMADEDEEAVTVEYAARGKRRRTRTICSDA